MSTILVKDKKFAVYAKAQTSLKPFDVYTESKKSGIITANAGSSILNHPELDMSIPLDFDTWLPFAAPGYHISPDPKDYIMVPVIVMPSDLPNRNKVAFPLKELIKFNPERGMQAYKTWKGKPTYLEHKNNDFTQAYGVIADSFMRKLEGWSDGKVWKVILLLAFDKTKNPDIVNAIVEGQSNSYSMGAMVSHYECSYCNAEVGKCEHIKVDKVKGGVGNPTMYELNGKLVFPNCCGIEGFETSNVDTPAYISAISDKRLTYA